jgi:hypothetical protein
MATENVIVVNDESGEQFIAVELIIDEENSNAGECRSVTGMFDIFGPCPSPYGPCPLKPCTK